MSGDRLMSSTPPLLLTREELCELTGNTLSDEQLPEVFAALDALRAVDPAAAEAEAVRLRKEYQAGARATLVRHHANKRRAAKLQRTPSWADQDAIKALHAEADRLTRATGVPHDVDHILPLQGRL